MERKLQSRDLVQKSRELVIKSTALMEESDNLLVESRKLIEMFRQIERRREYLSRESVNIVNDPLKV